MKKRKLIVSFLLTVLIALLSRNVSLADDKTNNKTNNNTNTEISEKIDFRQTRIARVAYIDGSGANIQRVGADEWDEAALNVPLFAGDLLYTNPESRTELELYGGFIRLSESASLELVKFTPKLYRFDLSHGLATFSFNQEHPEIEIATPQVAISVKKAGIYKIRVHLDGTTEVIVQEGDAELFARTSNFKLDKNKRAIFSPTNNVTVSNFDYKDEWDKWNYERENTISVNSMNGYLKPRPHLYGSSLLNQHGTWVNVSGYGFVWKPSNVSSNWAPYRIGRWAFYRRSGWTWVSYEPWGWLPYHHGRWAYFPEHGWVWIPGDLDWVWSPALVTWYNSTWNNVNYVCWHPRTDYWPNSGSGGNGNNWDGNFAYSMKDKFPVAVLEGVKSQREIISAIPLESLGAGNVSPKGFNHIDAPVGKVDNATEILRPITQGISVTNVNTTRAKNFTDLLSRPLVSKLGANDDNPRRKYDAPKGTSSSTSTSYTPTTVISSSPENSKKTPKTVENEPKLRGGGVINTGGISTNNSNNSNNSNNNSQGSGKSSLSEKVHREPSVSSSPRSAPISVSPSTNSNGSTSSGGGHRGGGKSKQ
jgi:hypothetical protein